MKRWLFIAATFLLGGSLLLRADFNTDSHIVSPDAMTQGGQDGVAFTSHELNSSVGQTGVSTLTFTSHLLYSGLMNMVSFPGAVLDLDSLTLSSSSIQLQWSAPGIDGAEGSLLAETSYFIQHSTNPNSSWDFSQAQIIIGTNNVTPTDLQTTVAQSLWPNTTYFFRLWTRDPEGNLSGLSNGTTQTTLTRVVTLLPTTFLNVHASSAIVAWAALPVSPSSASSHGYIVEASTDTNFQGTIAATQTPNVALSTLTVRGLQSDATYYFRAGTINSAGATNYQLLGSTLTLTSDDTTSPDAVSDLVATPFTATSMLLQWTAPLDTTNMPLAGNYAVQYASWTGVAWSTTNAQVIVSTSLVNSGDPQGIIIAGLDPNTTYYFRLWTADFTPNWSSDSNQVFETTLSSLVQNDQFVSIALSSATFSWDAHPTTPSSATVRGYTLQAATSSTFIGNIQSSTTFDLAVTTLTAFSLDPNTTHYFRVGSLNDKFATNYAAVYATSTWANAPLRNTTDFISVFFSSLTARWHSFAIDPSSVSSRGYVLEASSTNFDGTVVALSSLTTNVLVSTLTIDTMEANTTYYLRVGALNWNGIPHYTALTTTTTLADPPTAPTIVQSYSAGVLIGWNLPSGITNGFQLQASSTNFNQTGIVYSSITANPSLNQLLIWGLNANTTYYFKAGSLNHTNTPNFAATVATITLSLAPNRLPSDFINVYASSVTAQWTAYSSTITSGYRLEATSTTFTDLNSIVSSTTFNAAVSTLTVENLNANTTYHFRVGSLSSDGAASYTTLNTTATLSNAPVTAVSTYTTVWITSATVQWGTNGNPNQTLYVVRMSSASNFSGTILSSTTYATPAIVVDLTPNTSYYTDVKSVNHANISSDFIPLGSTVTKANIVDPAVTPVSPINISSLTVNYSAGSPNNPGDTRYLIQLSSFSDFSLVASSSDTILLSATFTALTANTTYFSRAKSLNRLGHASDAVEFSATPTLALVPTTAVSTYSAVTIDSLSMTWSSGTASDGYNPEGTTYVAQISADSNFLSGIFENTETTLSSSFSGLVPGTVYYGRAKAVNHQNISSDYTLLGSTRTSDSSIPAFNNSSVEVSNSQGQFISNALYTDTTTPNIRVQVQSTLSPGLAVTDTPGHLLSWHFDEETGNLALDSSNHSRDGTLTNSPAWITTGKFNNALDFNGSNSYVVSPSVVPFRNNAATSQWSINLWFRTSAATGFLCQITDGVTTGSSPYDGEISWHDTSGNLTFELSTSTGTIGNTARNYIQSNSNYADGAWHMATAVVDAIGMYLYVDGGLVASGTGVRSSNSRLYPGPTHVWIGAASVQGANMGGGNFRVFPGDIDDVLVSTVALSASQVADLYALGMKGITSGAPAVNISTQTGANDTWVRTSTQSWTIAGANGTTNAQLFTSSLTVANLSLRETSSPGADTNQIAFTAASIDANQTTAYYTILVDTTVPTGAGVSSFVEISSYSLNTNLNTASDALSGLAAAPHYVQISTDPNHVVSSNSGYIALASYTFTALMPNSTYYAKARARDAAGNVSSLSSNVSTVTLAKPVANIQLANVFVTSVTFNWTAFAASPSSATAAGYRLEASSTNFDGLATILSTTTTNVLLSTLTVENLQVNTTYYFRVASLNWGNAPTYANAQSTATRTNPPAGLALLDVAISSMTMQWDAPTDNAKQYRLELSSTNFNGTGTTYSSATTNVAISTLVVDTLSPNTTYYTRVKSLNWNDVPQYTNGASTSTWTNVPATPTFPNVYVSSAAVQWTTLNGGADGYRVDAATSTLFDPITASSATDNDSATSLTVEGLSSNSTYTFRVGAYNWNDVFQYSDSASTATKTSADAIAPNAITDLFASTDTATTMLLTWTAPLDTTDNPLSGSYAIQYATWTGVVWSTTNAQVIFSTANVSAGGSQGKVVTDLSNNTSYYFKIWLADARPNWSGESNQAFEVTFAYLLENFGIYAINSTSASFAWNAVAAPNADGYRLESSTTNFNGTGQTSVVATSNLSQSTLTLTGLFSNTTYYFRAGAVNHASTTNFVASISTITRSLPPVQLSSDFLNVYASSVAARWAAYSSTITKGYRLEATSITFNDSASIVSSTTYNAAVSTLTVLNLNANVTYYFRVAALNHDNDPAYTTLATTSTLANSPLTVVSTYSAVYITSAAVQWDTNGNSISTRYTLEMSSASNFSGTIRSSVTFNSPATVLNLLPDTSYYAQITATNNTGVVSGTLLLGSTVTKANVPDPAATIFEPVNISSLAVNFSSGTPVNPAGTKYNIQISSYSDFSALASSTTVLLSSTFTSLNPNTTYYTRSQAQNRMGHWSSFVDFGSTVTLAAMPGPIASTYTSVTADSVSITWSSGTVTDGFNPEGTWYVAQLASDSGFTTNLRETTFNTLDASFGGLIPGTVYYTRVKALNVLNVPTDFKTYGSTTTPNSSKPTFTDASVEISNSQGQFQSYTLYTDTTTPTIRVNVQSNFSPGLSMETNPSQIALWHLDAIAGSANVDSSLHNQTLALSGSPVPTLIADGQIKNAFAFDGQNYGVSGNLTPWRNAAATNQWSISLWFRSTLGRGFLFETADVATLGGITYDAEISWYDSTGNLAFSVTQTNGTRRYIQASASYADNNWHFVTAVLNTSGMLLFVDGSQVASGTQVTATGARRYTGGAIYAWVGAATTEGTNLGGGAFQYFPGDIDDVLISTVPLNLNQHRELYALGYEKGIAMGGPGVVLSTQTGANDTWVRISTSAWTITGTTGTTSTQLLTSSLSLSGLSLNQTASPGADTNQIAFIAASVDSNQTTAYYTIFVDTTVPTTPAISSIVNVSSYGFKTNWSAASDALSGLAAAPYQLWASTDSDFNVTNDSGLISLTSHTFTTLMPNSTYYAKARARDAAGNYSSFTSNSSTVTLAKPLTSVTLANVFVTSAAYHWAALATTPSSATAAGYRLEASTTDFDGTGDVLSSATTNINLSTLTVQNLTVNTTYYFRSASLNWLNVPSYTTAQTTATLTNAPGNVSLVDVYTASMTFNWSLPTDNAKEYRLQASSTNFNGFGIVYSSITTNMTISTLTVIDLDPNTTYYIRVGALNWNNIIQYTLADATSTLTNAPESPSFVNVFVSSVAVSWTLPTGGAVGFKVDAATSTEFEPVTSSSATANNITTTLTVEGLSSDSTFYFRVGAYNWNNRFQFSTNITTKTQTSVDAVAPNAINDLSVSTDTSSSMRLTWTAPVDTTDNPLSGTYAIQYATWTGVTWSTTNAQVVFSTANVSAGASQGRVVTSLSPNTSYYFKIWLADARPNWSNESNQALGVTLASLLENSTFLNMYLTSATLAWNQIAPLDAAGYTIAASSTDFNGTGQTYVSSTTNLATSTLTIAGLTSNTTYYYRTASLNRLNVANYSAFFTSSTLANPIQRLSFDFLNVYPSSVQVHWTALASSVSVGYTIEATSTTFNNPANIVSSTTYNVTVSTLTLINLNINTTYFFRVASLNHDNVPNYVTLDTTSTLSNPPLTQISTYTAVYASSATVQWNTNSNPADTLFMVEMSSASNFSGTIQSSTTFGSSAIVINLIPNTSYYTQVLSINHNNVSSIVTPLGSTVTKANVPDTVAETYAPVNISSLTINFSSGTPTNPPGTIYNVQLSSFSNFSLIAASSDTSVISSTLTALTANTTYFTRIRALNRMGHASDFTDYGSTVTLAIIPGPITSTYTSVTANTVSITWSSGTTTDGYNPTGTSYVVQLARDTGFSIGLQETTVSNIDATFGGLIPGTVYYTRVKALNHLNIPTDFRTYGSTTTSNSSKPAFNDGSVEVSNSQGQFQNYALYTDTTTPYIRVNVQSTYAPGLAVTDTTSHLLLWHFDDGSGFTALDSSKHNRNGSLTNSPSWITTGQLGKALDFNGSNSYVVSPSLLPWRNSATTNQWSISLWFRTTLGRGFLSQVANSNITGASTYDAEISWHDSSGRLSFEVTTAGGTPNIIESGSAYNDGNWHFATAVLNPSGMALYVDGEQVAGGTGVNSTTARTYAGPTYLWVGGASVQSANLGGGAFQYFPGDIDEVLVSTVALSLQQHAELYALNGTRGIALGAPHVEISTQSGAGFTWVRTATASWAITGTNGTTNIQTFTSSLPATGLSLLQTESPGADTNQMAFIASAVDSEQTTAYYTILVDTTVPTTPNISSLVDVTSSTLKANWTIASDALSGLAAAPYQIWISTDPSYSTYNDSGLVTLTSHTFTGLIPNSTYYAKVRARDAAGNYSAFSANDSVTTLANVATNVDVLSVNLSSITFNWTPRPLSPSTTTAKAYALEISTESDFSLIWVSSASTDISQSSWSIGNLSGDVTYYFRIGTLNWTDATNYAVSVSTLLPRSLNLVLSTDTIALGGLTNMNTRTVITSSVVVTNIGNVTATYEFRASTITLGSPWVIGPTQDIDQYVLWTVVNSTEPAEGDFADEDRLADTYTRCTESALTMENQTCIAVPAGETRTIWFMLGTPTATSTGASQQIQIKGRATLPD